MILVSVFRNASGYVERYIEQVKALRDYAPVKVVCAEGDSDDDTYDLLRASDFTVLKVEHGGPMFPSVDHPLRWRQLAAVCNVALCAAIREMDDEPLVYVESDLIWDAATLLELGDLASRHGAVAPMCFQNARFYDIWGYRKDGRRFNPYPPYHPDIADSGLTEIDSAGSCIAMSPTAAEVAHFSAQNCILGIGDSLRNAGLALYLAPHLKIHHPERSP